jgi:signal peptide peptidase SppA
MSMLVHLADRVLNRPLLITPDKAAVILSVLAGRLGVLDVEASRFVGDDTARDETGTVLRDDDGYPRQLPYRRTASGVGIVTVTGSLVNRGAWVGARSGLTSYEGVRHQIQSAAADPQVRSIILDLHSPGGEAVGAFETAAVVREAARSKPVTAVVNGMAASAAYAIASGAAEIVATESGVVGSIGVVLLHADYSRALEAEGIAPTLIFAGAHKVDGNPFEPLSAAVRSDLQAEVDAIYGQFLRTVASGRGGRLTADAARATEARTFIGADAVAAGLADRVGSFEDVLADLSSLPRAGPRGASLPTPKGPDMSDTTPAPAAETTGFPKAEHEAAVARAREDGAKASTDRLVAVLGADGIKGDGARMAAALDLAAKAPAMTATEVASFVTGNVPAAAAPGQDFTARMSGVTQPQLGTGARGDAAAEGGNLVALAGQFRPKRR